jgi:hypothetical protein
MRDVERLFNLDPRTRQAVAELEAMIRERYPTATFDLSASPEDPSSFHLTAIVDIDDPDEVGDLVLDRVLELQVTEGIPLHVIPVRTPERIAAAKQARTSGRSGSHGSLGRLGLLRQ